MAGNVTIVDKKFDIDKDLSELTFVNDDNLKYKYAIRGIYSDGTPRIAYISCNTELVFTTVYYNSNFYHVKASTVDGNTALAKHMNEAGITKEVSINNNYTIMAIKPNSNIEVRESLIFNPFDISISEHIYSIYESTDIHYKIIDKEGVNYSITEMMDNNVIRTIDNLTGSQNFYFDLSAFDSIGYGKHDLKIVATNNDEYFTHSVTTSFEKLKITVPTIPTSSNLKEAIEHSKEIKKEIEYQNIRLKNTLIEKGVECSDSDKMSSLVDRVNNIKGFKIVPGDTHSIPGFVSKSNNTTTTMNVVTDFNVTMGGNLRLSLCYWLNTHYGSTLYAQIIVTVKRNSETYYTETIPLTITSTGSVYVNIDKINFESGDTLTVFMGFTKSYNNQYRLYSSLSNISFDLEEF